MAGHVVVASLALDVVVAAADAVNVVAETVDEIDFVLAEHVVAVSADVVNSEAVHETDLVLEDALDDFVG